MPNINPIIYRVRHDLAVASGWRDNSTGIILREVSGALEAVPQAMPAFREGQMVRFGTAASMAPFGTISQGALGRVTHIDHEYGMVSVDMGNGYPWLEDQTLSIAPSDAKTVAAIECLRSRDTMLTRAWRRIWSAVTNPATYAIAAFAAWTCG